MFLNLGITMIKKIQKILVILLLASSCVEPYWPDLKPERSSILAVDALVTDSPETQYVKLSISAPLDSQRYIPVNNATVNIQDDQGNTVPFYFREDGRYAPDNFSGIVGRSYKLQINMPDGNQYESDYQVLRSVQHFDSAYYSINELPTNDPTINIEGAQFYLDYPSEKDSDTYYLFQLEETYKYKPDLRLYYIIIQDGFEKPGFQQPLQCWKTSHINYFYISHSLATNSISEQTLPLHFVPFDTKQFSVRYSLLVTQIAVSKEIFDFYYKINQQNNSGSLYASQPYSIKGNMHCITKPDQQVLGSFVAGGVYKRRSYYNSPANGHFSYPVCDPLIDGPSLLGIIAAGGTPQHPLYFTLVGNIKGWAPEKCFMCEMEGGLITKPDFWIDQ